MAIDPLGDLTPTDVYPVHDQPPKFLVDVTRDTESPLDSTGPDLERSEYNTQELIVLDSDVADQGWIIEQFKQGLSSGGMELLLLDSESDAWEQILEQLDSMNKVHAVRIFSHGDQGLLSLGGEQFDLGRVREHSSQLALLADHLSDDADLLVYGCNVGSGQKGLTFLKEIADLSGADVAASCDLTGARELGGDWELEVSIGTITTKNMLSTLAMPGWLHTLETTSLNLYLDPLSAGANTSTLDTAGPVAVAAVVPDFDGLDSSPGRLLKESNRGLSETNADSIHAWQFAHGSQNPLHINGEVDLRVFGALRDFVTNKTGALEAWLLDLDSNGNVVAQIANGTATRFMSVPGFAPYDIEFGTVDYHLAAGHSLKLVLVTPSQLSQGDMWVAYDTLAQPSVLSLTVDTGYGSQSVADDAYTVPEDTVLSANGDFAIAGWQARRQISFNNGMRSQALSDFPVLITLDATKIDYGLTQNDGGDLRFIDADGTVLDYEIESWDESGTSRVWVRVPTIDASSNADFIWMYYGNSAVANGDNAGGVWSNLHDGVYHLNEVANANGQRLADSSMNGHDGTNIGSIDAIGPIGNGQEFDGINDRINLGSNRPFLRNVPGATLSAWIAPDIVTGNRHIVGVSHATDPSYSRAALELQGSEIRVYGRNYDTGLNFITSVTTTTSPLTPGVWHHVTAVVDYAGNSIKVYVDGIQQATTGFVYFAGIGTPNTNPLAAAIGANEDGSSLFYDGKMDEVRIERTARSAAWVSAQYASMVGTLTNFGAEQRNGGVLANDESLAWENAIARVTTGPAHGILVFQADGRFQYTPNANFNGVDGFAYEIISDSGMSTKGQVTLNVTAVNDAPTGSVDTYTVAEGGTLVSAPASVLNNDSDIDGDALHAMVGSGPSHGTLTFRSDGTFDYVHNGSETTFDSFTYYVGDTNNATSNLIQVRISITPVNDAPVAGPASAIVAEGGTVTVDVAALASDSDSPGGLTVRLIGGPSNGTASIHANGSIVYRHNGSETNSDAVRFQILDSQGAASAIQTLNITVTPVNDAPIAVNDSLAGTEDIPIIISEAALLVNDTDPEGGLLHFVRLLNSGAGALADNGNDTWTYTAAANFNGSVTLRYQVRDGSGEISSADLRINIAPVNDAPMVTNLAGNVNEDGQVTIDPSGAITDIDGAAPFTRIITRGPNHGTLSLDANGRFIYRHDGSETISDSAEFRVRDAAGAISAVATINFTINPVNDNPVAISETLAGLEDNAFIIRESILLANDSDAEGDQLRVTNMTVSAGTIANNRDGTWTFRPTLNSFGRVDLNYQITDGNRGTASVTSVINVAAVNDAPIAADDNVTVLEDAVLPAGQYRLLLNDRDIEGSALTAQLVSSTSHGTVLLNADGTFIYTPQANYFGSDSFDYRVSDGELTSANARVRITVQSVNDAPVTISQQANVDEGGIISGAYLPAGATDIEGDSLRIASALTPGHGTVSWNADGTFQYRHDGSESITDTIQFQIADGNGGMTLGTVNLTVRPVNDSPVTQADRFDVNPNGRLTVLQDGVLANDNDPEGGVMQVNLISGPAFGSLIMQPNGLFEYIPQNGFVGMDTFTYTATDGQRISTPTTVTLVVLAPQGSNGNAGTGTTIVDTGTVPAPNLAATTPVPSSLPVVPLVELKGANDAETEQSKAENRVDSDQMLVPPMAIVQRIDVASVSGSGLSAREGNADAAHPSRALNAMLYGSATYDSAPTIGKIELSSLQATAPLSVIIQSIATEIDAIQQDLTTSIATAGVVTGGILVATSTVSVGYVFWALRTGFLMASVLSSLPAWQSFDPVPLINHLDDEGDAMDEDDAMERMMDAR